MSWTVETLGGLVDAELARLPSDMKARLQRIAGLIEMFGLEQVHRPYTEHLSGPLWEIRLNGRAGIARAIYVIAPGRRVVIVRIFVKKTQKTPRRELDLALVRSREVI